MESSEYLTLTLTKHFEVLIHYREEELVWDASGYRKAKYRPEYFDLFAEINAFIRTQPKAVSKHLFDNYQKIYNVFYKDNLTINEQASRLIGLVRDFSSVFNFEEMNSWVRNSANVVIPPTFETKYHDPATKKVTALDFDDEKSHVEPRTIIQASTRDKTYLRDDYIELLGLTIYMRLFVPIWGMYVAQTKDEIGTTFEEYYAGQLLIGSKNITESSAYQKLYAYLYSHVQNADKRANAVLDGLSSEDFPQWVLNLVLVRRIAIADVRGIKTNAHGGNTTVVTYIHSYVDQRIIKNKESFSLGQIREKKPPSSNRMDEETNMSIFESVRVSEDLSPGDIVELGLYFSDMRRVVEVLCPDLPDTLLEQGITAAQTLHNKDIHSVQVQILQWIIGPYMYPNALLNISKVQIINLLGTAQAILWHRGFYDIAAILTLTEMVKNENIIPHITRSNIPPQLLAEAAELYPHYRRASGRQPATRPAPVVVDVVKTLVNELLECDWRLNIHSAWKLTQLQTTGLRPHEYRIPSDIRIQLMELVLRVGRYRFPFHAEPSL